MQSEYKSAFESQSKFVTPIHCLLSFSYSINISFYFFFFVMFVGLGVLPKHFLTKEELFILIKFRNPFVVLSAMISCFSCLFSLHFYFIVTILI